MGKAAAHSGRHRSCTSWLACVWRVLWRDGQLNKPSRHTDIITTSLSSLTLGVPDSQVISLTHTGTKDRLTSSQIRTVLTRHPRNPSCKDTTTHHTHRGHSQQACRDDLVSTACQETWTHTHTHVMNLLMKVLSARPSSAIETRACVCACAPAVFCCQHSAVKNPILALSVSPSWSIISSAGEKDKRERMCV